MGLSGTDPHDRLNTGRHLNNNKNEKRVGGKQNCDLTNPWLLVYTLPEIL
jgi:hypothetical protein